tara:strand:- start:77 stop:1009 length:933 start_codon:yes stop_codon:yes gene_type:complete
MKKKKKKTKIISLTWLLLIVFLIWLISIIVIWFTFSDWTKSGTFGDTFGSINSLFSGLALAGIIYTINLQKKELRMQRKELKYTRKELKRTANAQEFTSKLLNEQIRISNIPIIEYDSEFGKKDDYLIIKNLSDNAAFDIEIDIYVMVSKYDYPISEFIKDCVDTKSRQFIDINDFIDDQFYCIHEKGGYQAFPKNKYILVHLDYPVDTEYFHLFIQYRDSMGNNYAQQSFFGDLNDSSKPFNQISTEPIVPTLYDRIDWSKEVPIDNIPEFAQNIYHFKNSSIFISNLKYKEYRGIEDAWEMFDIDAGV